MRMGHPFLALTLNLNRGKMIEDMSPTQWGQIRLRTHISQPYPTASTTQNLICANSHIFLYPPPPPSQGSILPEDAYIVWRTDIEWSNDYACFSSSNTLNDDRYISSKSKV